MFLPDGNGDDGYVKYSVKELLAELNRKVDVLDGKLDSKADAAALVVLEGQVNALDEEVARLRSQMDHDHMVETEKRDHLRWLIPTLLTAVFITSNVLIMLHL